MTLQKVIVESSSVEEAINEGLQRLGKNKAHTKIEILQDAREGLFNREARRARVRMTAEGTDLPQHARYLISSILRMLGMDDFKLSIDVDERFYRAEIHSPEDCSAIIGPRGETLNAIEHITQCGLRRHAEEPVELLLDVEGFRERRQTELELRAQKAARQALEQQSEVELRPMIAREREIVHRVIDSLEGVKSYSIGEDINRRVVILPKGLA